MASLFSKCEAQQVGLSRIDGVGDMAIMKGNCLPMKSKMPILCLLEIFVAFDTLAKLNVNNLFLKIDCRTMTKGPRRS